jgi:RNA polymerase sigma-70 factor (ECF subfamily)
MSSDRRGRATMLAETGAAETAPARSAATPAPARADGSAGSAAAAGEPGSVAAAGGADAKAAPAGTATGSAGAAYALDWSALMEKAQNGDAAAYRSLLESVAPYLRALAARRHRDPGDIEDAVQDILLTVHAIRHTYDPARPFGPWLVAIANRRLIDRLRRQGRTRARETALDPALEQAHETFVAAEANLYAERLERGALEAAVAGLPPRQREAITLLKLQELTLKEASEASGLSIASLKVSVHRGMKSLKKMIGDRSDGT